MRRAGRTAEGSDPRFRAYRGDGTGPDDRPRAPCRGSAPPGGPERTLTLRLERLAGDRDPLVGWLAAAFAGRLSYEDAEDLVAEALIRLAEDPRLPRDRAQARAYVRR